jgi:hypothetical protein
LKYKTIPPLKGGGQERKWQGDDNSSEQKTSPFNPHLIAPPFAITHANRTRGSSPSNELCIQHQESSIKNPTSRIQHMKTFISILILGVVTAAFIGGMFYGRFKPTPPSPQQLTLEQILSIKELHLVKHTYTDLFFLHKHNDPSKAIRAIVQVPVVVTAYLDLKEIKLIKENDSVRQKKYA